MKCGTFNVCITMLYNALHFTQCLHFILYTVHYNVFYTVNYSTMHYTMLYSLHCALHCALHFTSCITLCFTLYTVLQCSCKVHFTESNGQCKEVNWWMVLEKPNSLERTQWFWKISNDEWFWKTQWFFERIHMIMVLKEANW